RDAAMIALMLFAGLDAAAVAGLDYADYDDNEGQLCWSMQPRARSGATALRRRLIVTEELGALLSAWLAVRGPGRGGLFLKVDALGRPREGSELGARAVRQVARERARICGLLRTGAPDLRATYLAHLRDEIRRNPWWTGSGYGIEEDGGACLISV